MVYQQINSTRLFVERHGAGRPVVLVHDRGDERGIWAPVVAALRGSFTVVTYDLRGHGRSGGERPVGTEALDSLVADLAALLDQLGYESVHLVGHDLGGAVAQRLALQSAGRVRTLVLEAALPAPPGEPAPLLTEDSPEPAGQDDVAETSHMAIGAPTGLLSDAYAISRLEAIECPTLVVVGDLDTPEFQRGAELLHGWMPNSRLVQIEGAGHAPHVEQPARFNAHLRAFLAEFG
jgi:pimeloyl-ACP methyl ester carboxylesterase